MKESLKKKKEYFDSLFNELTAEYECEIKKNKELIKELTLQLLENQGTIMKLNMELERTVKRTELTNGFPLSTDAFVYTIGCVRFIQYGDGGVRVRSTYSTKIKDIGYDDWLQDNCAQLIVIKSKATLSHYKHFGTKVFRTEEECKAAIDAIKERYNGTNLCRHFELTVDESLNRSSYARSNSDKHHDSISGLFYTHTFEQYKDDDDNFWYCKQCGYVLED